MDLCYAMAKIEMATTMIRWVWWDDDKRFEVAKIPIRPEWCQKFLVPVFGYFVVCDMQLHTYGYAVFSSIPDSIQNLRASPQRMKDRRRTDR